ncbi:hypothetical protein K438DRAFT_1840182 [Mycena galopus ATCC 62051]|nr:hypothetical protein K438DRAFT_1840182 [Mycena galopus ATCC 62051]
MSSFLHSLQRRRRIAMRRSQLEFLILDHFKGDTIQLRHFCLVSHAWATHAQSLLFRIMYVRPSNLKRFLAVLQTRNNLGRHIVALRVIEGIYWSAREEHSTVLEALGHVLAERLPNLRILDLSYKHFKFEAAQSATWWTSISRLHVRFSQFPTAEGMIAFIAAFPRLESLDVFQCSVGDRHHRLPATEWRSSIPVPAWHLKYLALEAFPRNTIIDWMAADQATIAVDYLRILSLGPDASSFNALLQKVGGGLQHLELPAIHHYNNLTQGLEVALSIRACTALTTLNFSERGAFDPGRGLISLLSQVSSRSLTTISFEIYLRGGGHLDMPWEDIENMLSRDTFGTLKAVKFNVWGGQCDSDDRDMTLYNEAVMLMQHRLALSAARGLLQFKLAADDTLTPYAFVPPKARTTLRKRTWRKIAGWLGRDESSRSVSLITL